MHFDISVGNFINILIIAAGTGICSLNILQISSGIRLRKEVIRYFQLFFSMIILYMLMHLARQMMDGFAGSGVRISLYIVTFIEFLSSAFMAYLISLLVLFIASPKEQKAIRIVLFAVFIINALLLVVSQFNNMFYYFDEANIYHRAPAYIISNLAHIIMMIVDIYLLIRYRKSFEKRIAVSLWVYILLPLVAIAIQAFVDDVQFIILATVGGAVYMFGTIILDQFEKYEKQKEENSRIETELNMASAIQADMLPNIYPAFPEREEFDIYASMTPAKEVGGDFYDFFLVDDDHLAIVMADVSGKGVPAALFMMISKILVQNYTMMGKNAAQSLEAVNNQICANNREDMFVTVWLGILDLTTGRLTASNAGHEYPVLKDADGSFMPFQDKHGFVIGGMDGIKYKEYELQLQPGAKLFLYTDGVPEATNENNELFGIQRLTDALCSAQDGSPKEVLEAVDKSVKDFVKNAPQFDDLTMLCLHYYGK